ncbi:MAG TPA: hypothetical protein VFZ22_19345, partial [Pyrinomonadaceae bacterium]|nr:hypothetical protein [Pyrinomonadaceae bacterium]
ALQQENEIMTTKRKSSKKTTAKKATAKKATKKTAKKRATPMRKPQAAFALATNARKPAQERVKAFIEAPLAVCQSDENLQASLDVLRNPKEPIKVRLAALQSLQAASFSVIQFEACREDYLAALREVVDDKNAELRQRALGILARQKDGYSQKRLLEGLKEPDKALVAPEKALQLLSYDVHAEAYPVARDIVSEPPSPEAKREALRLLSADASSAPMFEKLLRDKNEDREIRQISAAALQTVKPKKFEQQARELLLDKDEYDDIQATALTALTQFGDEKNVAGDAALMKRVDQLGKGKSAKVKKPAKQFLNRYGK